MSDFRLVVREETGFQIFLEPAVCSEARYLPSIQWRRFDEQPFAVVQTVKCTEPEAVPLPKGKALKSRTIVVLRGLAGFEELHQDFDLAKHKNGAKDAIEAADKFLRTLWPKIEQERAAETVAKKDQAAQKDDAAGDPAPAKVVPASNKR